MSVQIISSYFSTTATTTDPPNIDDSKDDKSELTKLSWLDTAKA